MGRKRHSLEKAKTLDDVLMGDLGIYPDNFRLEPLDVERIIDFAGGFWRHNGDPRSPHVELRSGLHSDGFVSFPAAAKFARINDMFATALANMIDDDEESDDQIDWVVGSDHAAGTFSYAVVNRLMKRWPRIKHDFTEKVKLADGSEIQKWGRHVIEKGERVLQIEELCTKFVTVKRVREGIARAHPYSITYVPIVGMGVNRTNRMTFDGSNIVSLLDISFKEWPKDKCELCAKGSVVLANVKKSAEAWAALTGRSAA